jgi:hypothetical protein
MNRVFMFILNFSAREKEKRLYLQGILIQDTNQISGRSNYT